MQQLLDKQPYKRPLHAGAWILVCLFILMTERDRTDRTCFKHTPLEMLQRNDLNEALAGRKV